MLLRFCAAAVLLACAAAASEAAPPAEQGFPKYFDAKASLSALCCGAAGGSDGAKLLGCIKRRAPGPPPEPSAGKKRKAPKQALDGTGRVLVLTEARPYNAKFRISPHAMSSVCFLASLLLSQAESAALIGDPVLKFITSCTYYPSKIDEMVVMSSDHCSVRFGLHSSQVTDDILDYGSHAAAFNAAYAAAHGYSFLAERGPKPDNSPQARKAILDFVFIKLGLPICSTCSCAICSAVHSYCLPFMTPLMPYYLLSSCYLLGCIFLYVYMN